MDKEEKRLKVARIIKNAREKKGLSQLQLAEKVGLSKSSIFRIEKGKFSPNGDLLYAIISALDEEIIIAGEIL